MATIINDRDILLQAATARLNVLNTNNISFAASASGFSVNGTTVTPSTIKVTFTLNGRLAGTPTITYSGASAVSVVNVSNTITEVTVAAASMTADNCSITATLNYLGGTYTATAIVPGSVSAPGAPAIPVITVDGLNLRLTWVRNSEIDVAGYEVRDTDSNWGSTVVPYLYNGSATTCTVAPGSLNVAKTYYIRAYDSSNLYSPTTSVAYTVTVPSAPTGVAATFSSTSATASNINITWNNVIPPFGFKQYRVRVTLPNSSFVDYVVNTPNLSVLASWSGIATAQVFVTDILGNESAGSTSYNLVKSAPNAVTTPITIAPVGTKLLLDWSEVTKTSLPIIGYEVRTSDANWGDGSTFVWKGLVSECQVTPGALNTPVNYYVKAIDSDNVYSATAVATGYTRTAPPSVTTVNYQYSTTTTGHANITFTWNRPAGETFAIQLYRVTLTKPGSVVITTDSYTTSWTVNADWVGTAVLNIQTIDALGVVSSAYNLNIVKVPPNVTGSTISATPVNNSLVASWTAPTSRVVSWTRAGTVATVTDTGHGYETGALINITASSSTPAIPIGTYTVTYISANSYSFTCLNAGAASGTFTDATTSSLQITQYELRASNNSTVIYRGSSLNFALQANNVVAGTNTYYLYAIDSAGKYSNSQSFTYNYVIPGTVTALPAVFTSSGTALFKWSLPSTGSFGVAGYELSLTAPLMTTVTATRSTTDWEVPVGWSNATATLTITARDTLGNLGTSATITLQNTLLDTPSVVNTPTLRGTILEMGWTPNTISATQLPVSWYELRDYTNTAVVWKGSNSKASISLVGVTPAQNTWYLYAYDTNKQPCATPRTFTYSSLVNPSAIPTIVYSFGTNISDSTLTLSWTAQTPLFGLKSYRVTYSDWDSVNGDKTVSTTVLSNSINISPIPRGTGGTTWTGNKDFSVVVIDQLGNESTVKTQTIVKNSPGALSNVLAQVIDNNVLLSWTQPNRTTLPIDTIRIKKSLAVNNAIASGDTWSNVTVIGDKTGTFTSIFERTGGSYVYWLSAVDTDGVEGPVSTIVTTVSQPPDYIFNGQLYSTFSGTKVNAYADSGGLVMPVDTAINWSAHYTTNSWTTPQNQVDAGFPVYIQPSLSTGSYTEIFDFGQVFSSTKVTINMLGSTVAGTVNVTSTMDVSPDNVNWLSQPYSGTSMFASNFRYVRVIINVSQTDGNHGVYRLNSLNVSLDSKAKNDAGNVTTSAVTNTATGVIAGAAVVAFAQEFIDVSSINLTINSSGTNVLIPFYDFKDAVLTGSYSVTSNVCTVTIPAGHGFTANLSGQKVRLSISTGSGKAGVYVITYVSTTVFTVSMVVANTSGNLSMYSQSAVAYVYNNSNTAQGGITVSWAVRGY